MLKKETLLKLVAPLMIGSLVLIPLSLSVSAYTSENENGINKQIKKEVLGLTNGINAENLQAKAKQMKIYGSEGNITIMDTQLVKLMRPQNL